MKGAEIAFCMRQPSNLFGFILESVTLFFPAFLWLMGENEMTGSMF